MKKDLLKLKNCGISVQSSGKKEEHGRLVIIKQSGKKKLFLSWKTIINAYQNKGTNKKPYIFEQFSSFSLDWWKEKKKKDTPRHKFWLECVNSKNKEEIFTSFQAERIKFLTMKSRKITVASDFLWAQLKLEKNEIAFSLRWRYTA